MTADYVVVDLSTPSAGDVASLMKSAAGWVEKTYSDVRTVEHEFPPIILVLRFDPRFNWTLTESELLDVWRNINAIVLRRFDPLSLYLIYSEDFELNAFGHQGSLQGPAREALLAGIRSFELEEIAFSSGTLYHNRGAHLYQHPSGEISDFFFRAGNLQSRYGVMPKIWFWIIPYVSSISYVVADTWSISTLAAYVACRIESYRNDGQVVDWSYLQGYIGDDVALKEQIGDVFEGKNAAKHILFLLSASASGRSIRSIRTIADQYAVAKERLVVVTLFALSKSVETDTHLCSMVKRLSSLQLEGFSVSNSLKADSVKYVINSSTYFPIYQPDIPYDFRFALTSEGSHTKKNKRFFEDYSGFEIFSVCRNGTSNRTLKKPKHHAFHVDVRKLFQQKPFLKRLDEVLQKITAANRLFHLSTEADRQLADMICERLEEKVERVEVASIKDLAKTEKFLEGLPLEDASFVIVDALAITGNSRLSQFQKALRNIFKDNEVAEADIRFHIDYVVGLTRFDSDRDDEIITRYFPQSAPFSRKYLSFHCVENVTLPDWSEEQCPWCREKVILRNAVEASAQELVPEERRYIQKRLEALSVPSGLRSSVFFRRYPSDQGEFNPGSLFLDENKIRKDDGAVLSEADLVCAAAASIQTWRATANREKPANYTMGAEVVFHTNIFNETAIRAAIWRVLKPNEIALLSDSDVQTARSLLNTIFNSAEIDQETNRAGNFVLGMEAALVFGIKVKWLLGDDAFASIDWKFLQDVADRRKPMVI